MNKQTTSHLELNVVRRRFLRLLGCHTQSNWIEQSHPRGYTWTDDTGRTIWVDKEDCPNRYRLSVVYPRTKQDKFAANNVPHPEITISQNRKAADAARDVARRLIADYDKHLATVREVIAGLEKNANAKLSAIESVKAAGFTFTQFSSRFYQQGQTEPRWDGTIHFNGDVDLTFQSLPVNLAIKAVQLITKAHTELTPKELFSTSTPC